MPGRFSVTPDGAAKKGVLVNRLAISLSIALVVGAGSAEAGAGGAKETGEEELQFLTRTRQLSYEGLRAGEGYYSPDGTKMVFQSERDPKNPFYQIFELDLTTGETRQVSPGQGKTTCAFIRPGSGDIVFASTHHDPKSEQYQKEELEFRASGKERRYSWDYDPEMELYVENHETGELTRLTHAKGYDAEASYSPDGEWIVFSSNHHAYASDLSEHLKKKLEIDPSYFLDLYRVRADGTDLERLTVVPGYDGGPFFSFDGKHIVWRRFDEEGLTAEVWLANADGSEARAVTSFGAMSWAPYVHPSGDYIIFTSNKLGFANFELFIVDVEGTKEPVRVTYTDGFDGLPVPTPDGNGMTWTTNRRGSSQLFTAKWNHANALKALNEAPARQELPKKESSSK